MVDESLKPEEKKEEKPQELEEKKLEEKKEDSPYKAELERLKQKFEKELAHKERAIQSKDENNKELLAELQEIKASLNGADDDVVEVEGTKFKKGEIESLNKALKAIGISSTDWKGVSESLQEIRSHLAETRQESYIGRVTSNAEEAELIRYHLKNTIKPTGNIEDDVRNARAIANRHMTEAQENEETARAAEMAATGGIDVGPGSRISITSGMTSGKREALKLLKSWQPNKKWETKI